MDGGKENKRQESSAYREEAVRTRRYVLATIAFLCLALIATQIFLNQTSVGSPRFPRVTFLLYTATVLVVLALLILATVLGRNLIKLYFERRSGQVGSRFKTKMVSIFIALSLLPAVVLFFLAYGLINYSIKQWFRAPADQMLAYSRGIAVQYYDELRARAQHFAALMAAALAAEQDPAGGGRTAAMQKLDELRRSYATDEVRLYDRNGRLAAVAAGPGAQAPSGATATDLAARALEGSAQFRVERVAPGDPLRQIAWAAVPLRDRDGGIAGALVTQTYILDSISFKADSVEEAYNAYRELQRREPALRFNFLLILALSSLLIVFAFSWFAVYLAKRITIPIQALAEGALAVAAGDLGHRVDCAAFDELENLVQSFNRMTAELQDNKRKIEAAQDRLRQTNIELEDRRRYIETILQTIATGVISLGGDGRIRTLNRAAAQMLGIQDSVEGRPLDEVVRGAAGDALQMQLRRSTVLGTVVRDLELHLPGKTLHLATTATPLVDAEGQHAGWVLVLDDLTELLRMEKMAAWREVAQRLAHEIKNPLTPIRLSAERVLKRYGRLAPQPASGAPGAAERQGESAAFDRLLRECMHTILQEAESLKSLVDEFSRFARLPQLRLEETDLHGVIEAALNLYNGRAQDVRLVRDFDAGVPRLRLDQEQMKRVLINLVDNALEAMAGCPPPRELTIRTACDRSQKLVRIEVADTGRGFPEEYRDSVFLPYFSIRKGGTGLGLAIVRQIVMDHHGQVRAEANNPRGARIIIDLPAISS